LSGDRCEEIKLKSLSEKAEVIVVAKVERVGKPLKAWSGYFLVVQRVRYKIEENIKGKISFKQINVAHYIMKNSMTADAEKPQLSETVFKKGNEIILFLKQDSGTGYISAENLKKKENAYIALDANCGAIVADTEKIKILKDVSKVEVTQSKAHD